MATYNGERFIRKQLTSILSQLGPEDEVIVSDDSSTDRTLDIITELNDCRIRVFEGNTFYCSIFNFENALRHAGGDIIILSDQDDIWLPNKVELILERFAGKQRPVYLMVLDAEVVDEDENVLYDSVFKKFRRVGPGLVANLVDNSYIGCCMAFSRDLLEYALPFPQSIPMHDMWLGLIAELFGTTEFVPVKSMRYRKHSNSSTEFCIRFTPWIQIKRRCFLAWHLAVRYVERTYRTGYHA